MTMARCGCAGTSCSCIIVGAGSISVDGAGSQTNPYVVSGGSAVQVTDTSTVNLSLVGIGSVTEPYQLSADALVSLNALTDVDTAGATTGQVLTRQSDGTYKLAPPVTATAGTINVGAGITGDGSSGNALRANLLSNGGLVTSGTGLAIEGNGSWVSWTPIWTATTTNPSLGNGTLVGAYMLMSKLCIFRLRLVFGSTTTRGVGSYQMSLPFAPKGNQEWLSNLIFNTVNSGVFLGLGRSSDSSVARMDALTVNTDLRGENITHSMPVSTGAGSRLEINGTYETLN